MFTTCDSQLPIVFRDSKMPSIDAKKKKKKNGGVGGRKQCGSCGGFAKNNKQNNCHHCEKKGLVIKNWLKKEKTKSTGRGLVCPRQGCEWSTKGNRTHNCKKCGAAFPSKSKRKAYVVTGKRKNRSEKSAFDSKKKKKKDNTTQTFSSCTVPISESPTVIPLANESRGQTTSFDIDFEKIFDESISESSNENSWTPIPQNADAEPIELSSGLFDDSIGPVELTRGSSLTPISQNAVGSVELTRESSLKPFAFDYSGINIPSSLECQNVYENEDSAISDFMMFFKSQEVSV